MRSSHIASITRSSGGLPKLPVSEADVTEHGLDGDRQRDTRHHGGSDRALCLFSLDRLEALSVEGHPIQPGTIGENITVRGLDWARVVPGERFRLGEAVVIEITEYTTPCRNIATAFVDGNFARVSQKRQPGWSRVYARVLATGRIRVGDPFIPIGPPEAPQLE